MMEKASTSAVARTGAAAVKVLSQLLLLSSNYTDQDNGLGPLESTTQLGRSEDFGKGTNGTEEMDVFNSTYHRGDTPGRGNYPVSIWQGSLYGDDDEHPEEFPLPLYIRVTAFVFLVIIFAVGTLGNTMVIIVINCSRDMRTSTNIFLVNLSIADLLVLLICTPTSIMEVYNDPEIWYLGEAMCKLVPLLEMTVYHTSVLTILAISFERYYAICCPLRANYVCTKARAVSMCVSAWLAAGIITSPVYFMTSYYEDPPTRPHCEVNAGSFWPDFYTISSIVLLFILPLFILIIMYRLIAKNLTSDSCRLSRTYTRANHRARRQVILMLGTVVFTFFLCLLPFRVLTLYILLSDHNSFTNMELYYNLLYFCRIMLYTNSALNPILYNIMSSKFRNGFLNLCSRKRRKMSRLQRRGTFHTMTTTSSISTTSNIPNNFIHSVAAGSGSSNPGAVMLSNERRMMMRQGIALYGQCCRCQCHDYVTHVWLSDNENNPAATAAAISGVPESARTPSSGSLMLLDVPTTTTAAAGQNNSKNKCRNKDKKKMRGISRNNNNNSAGSTSSTSSSSANPTNAHWYCRKCRENSKWESKYLLYGSASSPSTSPIPTTALLNQRNRNTHLNGYTTSYPTQYSSFATRQNDHHHHHQNHQQQNPTMRISFLQRCCILSCKMCKPSPPVERYGFHRESCSNHRGRGDSSNRRGKIPVKMALSSHSFCSSCSITSFSNTNTLETNL